MLESWSTLTWILVTGMAMSVIALAGSITLLLPERVFRRVLPALVGLAGGALLGGAFAHLLPAAIDEVGNRMSVWIALLAGFLVFFFLEQALHWHHHREPEPEHRPLGWLILLADGLHNLLGGLAIGGSFLVDVRVGLVAWGAAAAHEVPQELGDFGILVDAGWGRGRALVANLLSALTFPVGAVIAYAVAGRLETALLLPFAAGNFVYIGAADLVPHLTAGASDRRTRRVQAASFVTGLALLVVLAGVAP